MNHGDEYRTCKFVILWVTAHVCTVTGVSPTVNGGQVQVSVSTLSQRGSTPWFLLLLWSLPLVPWLLYPCSSLILSSVQTSNSATKPFLALFRSWLRVKCETLRKVYEALQDLAPFPLWLYPTSLPSVTQVQDSAVSGSCQPGSLLRVFALALPFARMLLTHICLADFLISLEALLSSRLLSEG